MEGLNRRRKKRTSIETNIRVALEKSFLEVSDQGPPVKAIALGNSNHSASTQSAVCRKEDNVAAANAS